MSRIVCRLVITGLLVSAVSVAAIADVASASPTPAAPAAGPTYTVRSGDSLYGIALRNRVRLADVLALNGLSVSSVIHPGMTLVLPAGATASTRPASVPAPPATSPAAATAGEYVVKPGDSLIRIAQRNGVRLGELLSLNRLTTSSLIWPGMRLALPAGATTTPTTTVAPSAPSTTAPAAAPAPAASGATYTVVAGDFLGRIAQRNGVRLADLLALNGLTATSLIVPGRVLQLPATATPATTTTATSNTTTTTTAPGAAPTGNSRTDAVLAFAQAQVGKPYKFFTAGPDTFDCSGLTMAAYQQAGVSLPHQSGAQSQLGTAIDWTTQTIAPGDLVFLTRDGSESSPITHVGIATSATTWIHATRPGDVVRSGTIPVWRIVEVRRYL